MALKIQAGVVLKDARGYYYTGNYNNNYWSSDWRDAEQFDRTEDAVQDINDKLAQEFAFDDVLENAVFPLTSETIYTKSKP